MFPSWTQLAVLLLPVGLRQPASKASRCCHLQFIILLNCLFFSTYRTKTGLSLQLLKVNGLCDGMTGLKFDGWKPFWLQLRQTHKENASLCTPGGVTKHPFAASSVVSVRVLARLSIKELAVCVFVFTCLHVFSSREWCQGSSGCKPR